MTRKLINLTLVTVAIAVLGIVASVAAPTQGQKTRTPMAKALKEGSANPQALYVDYKGVRIGMTAEEARAKLGQPASKGDDQDFYIFSEKETAQIVYDATLKVTVISVDYVDGAGAPDPRAVVGGDMEDRNGAIYKLVRYESQGFWVSYNRTAGPAVTVTITIQKIAS